jgi:hypothetical protein
MDRTDESKIEKGTDCLQPSPQTDVLRPDSGEDRYLKGLQLAQVYWYELSQNCSCRLRISNRSGLLITVLLVTLDQTIVLIYSI